MDREESFDLIDRFGEDPIENVTFSIGVKMHFYALTGGHGGALNALLATVMASDAGRRVKKIHGTVDIEHIEESMGSVRKLINLIRNDRTRSGALRGIPPDSKYQEQEFHRIIALCLRNGKIVLTNEQSARMEQKLPVVYDMYMEGYLHSDLSEAGKVELFFPSKLHKL
jgi:hypothetical protein